MYFEYEKKRIINKNIDLIGDLYIFEKILSNKNINYKIEISNENIIYPEEKDNGLFDFIFKNLSNKLENSNFNNSCYYFFTWKCYCSTKEKKEKML